MSPRQALPDRVTLAREFLAAAQRRRVADLPLSVLMREDAELRRILAEMLALIGDYEDDELQLAATHVTPDGGARIIPADVEVLARALTDAAAHRCQHAEAECADCDTSPAGLCGQGAADLDQADAYRALARSLGIGVQP